MLKIKVSNKGAELESINYNGREYLRSIDENWDRQSPILFPTVGRLKNGKTIINEKIYKMPLHGFAKDMEFNLIEESKNKKVYFLTENEETLKMYPYKFELFVTYIIEDKKLKVEYKVINTNKQDMTFGIGGHPGFRLDLKQTDYYFELEKEEENVEFMEVEGNLISSKPAKNILKDKKIIEIKEDSFINDAIMMKKLKSKYILLKEKATNKTLLKFNFKDFPVLAIWTIPNLDFICIEPWFTYGDTTNDTGIFKDKQGMITIKENEEFKCSFSVEF